VSAPGLPALLVTDWQLSPLPIATAAAVCAGYLAAARRPAAGWPRRRTAAFLAGLTVALVAANSGLERFDDRLLSAHMAQHMLLLLVAPLLVLIGRPLELVLRAVPARSRPALARALRRVGRGTGPPTCVVAFAVVVGLTHLPGFYAATLTHPALHDAEHALYLAAGALMWWPILDGDPVPRRRLDGLGRLLYLIVAMVPMTVLGAYLNRHPTLAYPAYGPPARVLGVSAVADQQHAGALMWVLGDVFMVAAGLWAAMHALVAEERRAQARERRARLTREGLAR
jgi:putative membrane protein